MTTVLELEKFAARRAGADSTAVVSMAVSAGEVVSLSGPSGCGKTLFLRAVADLDPCVGRALLDRLERRLYTGPEWRRRVAYVATESAWWSARAGDHFATSPDVDMLAQLGLAETILKQNTSRLSTGERQRLALLRSLSTEPRVLLLDEPTASLDRESALRMESLVRRWVRASATAVLWVCHDRNQRARIADRAFEFHDNTLRDIPRPERSWASSH